MSVAIHDVSVVCVNETWFKDYMGNDSLNLHGFNLERKDIKNGRAGGVASYLRSELLYSRLIAYRPLSRRLDRCDRVIQDEVGDSIRGNV